MKILEMVDTETNRQATAQTPKAAAKLLTTMATRLHRILPNPPLFLLLSPY